MKKTYIVYIGIVDFRSDYDSYIDILSLTINEERISELFNELNVIYKQKYDASIVIDEDRHKKYTSTTNNVIIDVFFIERILINYERKK